MFDEQTVDAARQLEARMSRSMRERYGQTADSLVGHSSSGIPLRTTYTPNSIKDLDYERVGVPGEYPYTRGIYPAQYQYQTWVNQSFMGFGLPEDTHARMMLLAKEGMTGYFGRTAFNIAFDLVAQAGLDPDHPAAQGRVGQCGVSVASVEDLDRLFRELPLEKISVSLVQPMASNAILAMYIALGEQRGVPQNELRGNTMNYLYAALHMDRFQFPPRPSMRLMVDLIKYTSRQMPKWNSTNLCGYNIRQSGANAVQELGFTLVIGAALTEACIAAGLHPDEFLPRFSFQMSAGSDLFEEVAKLRALRRMWATINRERFGPKDDRSLQARMHCHTDGAALTAQQPMNNIVRATLHTLAAVLGGANSLQTSAYDEAHSIPTEESHTLALRTQQIIRHETNLPSVTDPLGGSYYVEALTDEVEVGAYRVMEQVEKAGGFLKAWENGWFRQQIAAEAYRTRELVDKKEKVIVGVNEYVRDEEADIPTFAVESDRERIAVERIKEFRARRDNDQVAAALDRLREAAAGDEELMPSLIAAARSNATLGEMMGAMREVFGHYFGSKI